MSTNDGTVRILVKADDMTRAGLSRVEDNFKRLGSTLTGTLTGVAKFGAKLSAIGEAALLATPSLIAAGQAALSVAKAAGAAAPALAALAAAGLFVKMTLSAIAPDIVRYMKPIADAFDVASQKASFWATRGIRPLAAEWARAGMPIVSRDMTGIAREVNLVVKGFLEWGKGTAGLKALSEVTNSTARAVKALGPSVQGVAISFGNMLGRIASVSIAAGSSGLAGVLDKLNAKMDGITAETVTDGLNKLKKAFQDVRDAVLWVKDAVSVGTEFWFKYQEQIGYVRDALSVLAMAFGGPVGIAIGGASLITRHWDKVKPAIDSVKEAFDDFASSEGGKEAMERLGGAVAFLKGEWQDLADWFTGTLWPLIKDELPAIWESAKSALREVVGVWDENKEAIGQFYRVAKELGKMLMEHLVPVLGTYLVNNFKAIGQVIGTAIRGFGLFARAVTLAVRTALTVMEPLITVAIAAAEALGMDGVAKKLGGVLTAIGRVKNALDDVPTNKTINFNLATGAFYAKIAGMRSALNDVQFANAGRYAHGGIVGAATGGIHSGLRLVGEQGPELVSMAPGSRVHPAGATRNMLSGAGGGQGGELRVVVDLRGGNDDFTVMMRKLVKVYGGGNVQAAFGSGT